MNGIKLLNHDSVKVDSDLLVFFTLLADVYSNGTILVSKYSVKDVINIFNDNSKFDIPKTLKNLTIKKYIKLDEGQIVLGIVDSGIISLFSNSLKSDLTKEISIIKYKASKYTRVLKEALVKDFNERVEKLTYKDVDCYKVPDFIALYCICYEVHYQEPSRSFTGKEVGMLKNLLKTYEPIHLFKMIVSYVFEYEKYFRGSGVPNIAGLCYKKDEVYGNIREAKVVSKVYDEEQTKF